MPAMRIDLRTKDGRERRWEFPTDKHIPKLVSAAKESEPDWRTIVITLTNTAEGWAEVKKARA